MMYTKPIPALKPLTQFVFLLLFIFCFRDATAAVVTSTSSGGAWTSGSSWVGGISPASTDTAIISSGATLTISGTQTVGRVVFAVGNVLSATINLEDGASFNISGQLFLNQTIEDGANNTFNVANATATVGGIQYIASANDNRRAVVNIGSGTLNINGLLNFNGTNSPVRRGLILGAGGTVNLNGTVQGNGGTAFDATSNFNYLTSGNQNMIITTYGNLNVQGGGLKTFNSNNAVTVGGTLTLTNTNIKLNGLLTLQGNLVLNGVIEQNGRDIILGSSTNITGSFGVSAHISQINGGKLIKQSNITSGFLGTYPIGTSQGYTPFIITALDATLGGAVNSRSIEMSTFALKHPLATNVGSSLNSFWRLRSANINNIISFAATAAYTDAAIPAGVNEADLNTVARLTGTSGWFINPTAFNVNTADNNFVLLPANTAISGDYALGQTTSFSVVDKVFTIQDGSWGSNSTWSSNEVPGPTTNAIVIHRVNADPLNAVNFVTVETSGVLIYASNNTTINGNLDVFGKWFDTHSGGLNVIGGKTTLHPGSEAIFTGSGGTGLSTEFRGDVEVNSPFITPGQIQFTNSNSNKIKVSGSSSMTAGGIIWCNVDSLLITNSGGIINNDSLRIGSFTGTFNSVLWNNSRLSIGSQIIGRPSGNFQRKITQGPSGQLIIRSANPIFSNGTGDLDATTNGNTVEYAASSSQPILNTDYHHLTLTSDRSDRFKTLVGSRDITIGGNLTVNNNSSVFQCGNSMNGKTIRLNGNMILEGSGRIGISSPGTKVNLIIGGQVINNHTATVDFRLNDSTYYNTTFTGSGVISSGSGHFNFRSLKIAGGDTVRWNNSGVTNIFDSLSLRSTAFYAPHSSFFIPLSRTVRFTGSSTINKIAKLQLTDRADRSVQFYQQIPLEIDSVLNLESSSANQPAFYDFSGQKLVINNRLTGNTTGQNGANSLLRADSTSTLILRGNSTVNNLSFRQDYRNIGTLIIDKPESGVSIASGSSIRIYKELQMVNGSIVTNGRLSMHPRSHVWRKKGKLLGIFQNTSGKYNVTYTDSVTTGNELTSVPTLGKITVDAGQGNTVAIGNSPSVDSALVVRSGQLTALTNNFIRLTGSASVLVDRILPLTLFPVGSNTSRGFFELKVNSDPGGMLQLKPVLVAHPRRASAPSYIRRYVNLTGTATTPNVDLSVFYSNADIVGVEANLATSFYNGTTWTTANGSIDTLAGKATMTGINSFGDLTAGANMGDTTTNSASSFALNNIVIYPIPAQDRLFIEGDSKYLSGTIYKITDLSGKVLIENRFGLILDPIVVNSLKTGLYELKLINPKGQLLLQTPWIKQ